MAINHSLITLLLVTTDKLLSFESVDNISNPSDHIAIKCTLDLNIYYRDPYLTTCHIERPVWDSASDLDISHYEEYLNDYLLSIPVPYVLFQCNNNMCKTHCNEISKFLDNIVSALISACNESIPFSKPKCNAKVVPGWNNNVKEYFETAL